MSLALSQIAKRLVHSSVATSLSKEELCLCLASLARLEPRGATKESRVAQHTRCNHLSSAAPQGGGEALIQRVRRAVPVFTSREATAAFQGLAALHCKDDSLYDALIRKVYLNAVQSSTSGSPLVKFSDCVSLTTAAVDERHYSNASLRRLIVWCLEGLLYTPGAPLSPPVEEFLCQAGAYLGTADLLAVASSAESASHFPRESPLAELLRTWASKNEIVLMDVTVQQKLDRLLAQREACLAAVERTEAPGQGHAEPVTWTRAAACSAVYKFTSHLATSAKETPEMETLVDHLELVNHFNLDDTESLLLLDAAVVKVLRGLAPPRAGGARSDALRQAVFRRPLWYPKGVGYFSDFAAESLGASDAHPGRGESTALQVTSRVQELYCKMAQGEDIPDAVLHSMMNNLFKYTEEELLEVAAIFAKCREIPAAVMQAVSSKVGSSVAPLSSAFSVAALVSATRYDQSGGVMVLAEQLLSRWLRQGFIEDVVRSASAECLAALLTALSIPVGRAERPAEKLHAAETEVERIAASHLLSQLRGMNLRTMERCCGSLHRLGGQGMLKNAVCGRMLQLLQSGRPDTSRDTTNALCTLNLLASNHWVHEELLDVASSLLEEKWKSALPASKVSPAVRGSVLLFAKLQAQLDAPELEALATLIVQQARSPPPAQDRHTAGAMRAAALLLLSAHSRHSAAFSHLLQRSDEVAESIMQDAAGADVFMAALARVPSAQTVPPAVLTLIRSALADAASPAAQCPTTVAHMLVVVSRHHPSLTPAPLSLEVSDEALSRVGSRLASFSPQLLAALCEASSSHSCTSLAGLSNRLIETLPRVANALPTHELSRCLFALGEVEDAGQRLSHQLAASALADHLVDSMDHLWSGPDIARLVHGLARLHYTKRDVYNACANRVMERRVLVTLDRQAMSLLLAGLGAVKFLHKGLVDRLASVFEQHTGELTPADLLLSIKGHSRLHLLNRRFYRTLGDAAVARAGEFPLAAQCELLRAYGSVEEPHPSLACSLSQRIAADVELLGSPSRAVDVLTSLWYMGHQITTDAASLQLADHVVRHRSALCSADLVKLCSIVEDLQWRHTGLLGAVAEQAVLLRQQHQLDGVCARVVLDTLASQVVHHSGARQTLSRLAKSVSKEVILLTAEEGERLAISPQPALTDSE